VLLKESWISFKEMIDKFVGNNKVTNYEQVASNMLEKYTVLGYNMSPKILFLFSYLDQHPEILGTVSDQ
jgi:hypothetical protein